MATGFQEWKRNAYQIGMKWNLASGYVGASWMQALERQLHVRDPRRHRLRRHRCDAIGLGYYHTMSKQTQLYIMGSWIDNEETANYGPAGIGNSATFRNVGATVYGLGVGIKHSF